MKLKGLLNSVRSVEIPQFWQIPEIPIAIEFQWNFKAIVISGICFAHIYLCKTGVPQFFKSPLIWSAIIQHEQGQVSN